MVAGGARALLKPQPLPTDHRIKTVPYNKSDIFEFTGHYGYQSLIEFDPAEKIITISIGDSIAWQLQPSGSRLFLKPVEKDAQTNMTVVTDKRTYHFELHAKETEQINDKEMVFALRFVYPDSEEATYQLPYNEQDAPPDLTDPEIRKKMNFNYTITGPDAIAPLRIFDDGKFTYFQFPEKNATIPAFFLVGPDGNESIVNFRMEGDYVVVERVAPRFTLRHGPHVLCVNNKTMPLGRVPEPEEPSFWHQLF